MFFTLSNHQPLQICPHIYFFCSGSTHRPLVLTHLSLPQMQPFFHYPSVTGVRSRCAARLLSRSCVPWRRAPNKIWVRLKNPNFFLSACHKPACRRRTVIPGFLLAAFGAFFAVDWVLMGLSLGLLSNQAASSEFSFGKHVHRT